MASEHEELAEAVRTARWPNGACVTQGDLAREVISDALLGSDWLAAHDAAVEARVRETVSKEIEAEWIVWYNHGHSEHVDNDAHDCFEVFKRTTAIARGDA